MKHTIKAYGEFDVFLTSTLDGFTRGTHCRGDRVGFEAGLDRLDVGLILILAPKLVWIG